MFSMNDMLLMISIVYSSLGKHMCKLNNDTNDINNNDDDNTDFISGKLPAALVVRRPVILAK